MVKAANSSTGSRPMDTERPSPRFSGIDTWDPQDALDAMIKTVIALGRELYTTEIDSLTNVAGASLAVLVVDDDPSVLSVLQTQTKGHAIEASGEPSAGSALDRLGAQRFDVLVAKRHLNDLPGALVLAGSLMVTGTDTNHVRQAETAAKIKERFIELFGPPVFTIGSGTSGGSMSQHMVQQNYPGLMDAIMPWRSYPEVLTFQQPILDCNLLVNYFESNGDITWTDIQKRAVSGKVSFGGLMMAAAAFTQAQSSLRWFVDNFGGIADWRATLLRVASLRQVLASDLEAQPHGSRIAYVDGEPGTLAIDGLEVRAWAGHDRLDAGSVTVQAGQRLLILGTPGTEKTLLFRALAGLWPWGSGNVRRPRGETIH